MTAPLNPTRSTPPSNHGSQLLEGPSHYIRINGKLVTPPHRTPNLSQTATDATIDALAKPFARGQ